MSFQSQTNVTSSHSLRKAMSNSAFFHSRRLSTRRSYGIACWVTRCHLRPTAQSYRHMRVGNGSVFTTVGILLKVGHATPCFTEQERWKTEITLLVTQELLSPASKTICWQHTNINFSKERENSLLPEEPV